MTNFADPATPMSAELHLSLRDSLLAMRQAFRDARFTFGVEDRHRCIEPLREAAADLECDMVECRQAGHRPPGPGGMRNESHRLATLLRLMNQLPEGYAIYEAVERTSIAYRDSLVEAVDRALDELDGIR